MASSGNSHARLLPILYVCLVMRKPAFSICENKDADQLRGKRISAFVFATRLVQSLYFLNRKFQASSHLLWLYSLFYVGPGRKPRNRFSHNEAHVTIAKETHHPYHLDGFSTFNFKLSSHLSYSPSKSGVVSLILGFSNLSNESLE